jgi:hypothetical protein
MSGQGNRGARGKGGKGLGKGGAKRPHRDVLKPSITGIVPPGIKRTAFKALSSVANLFGVCGCFGTITCAKCAEERFKAKVNADRLAAEAKVKADRLTAKFNGPEDDVEPDNVGTKYPFYMLCSTTNSEFDNRLNCYLLKIDGENIFFFFDGSEDNVKIIKFHNTEDEEFFKFYNSGLAGYLSVDEDNVYKVTEKKLIFDVNHYQNDYENTYGAEIDLNDLDVSDDEEVSKQKDFVAPDGAIFADYFDRDDRDDSDNLDSSDDEGLDEIDDNDPRGVKYIADGYDSSDNEE